MKKIYDAVIDFDEATRSGNTFKFDYNVYNAVKDATSVRLLNVPQSATVNTKFYSIVTGIGHITTNNIYLVGSGALNGTSTTLFFAVKSGSNNIIVTYPA